jgi:ATP-dependent RNA helicase RhlE
LTTFNDFGLAEPILRALAEQQYETPTPIQLQAIPIVRDGHDLIGIAQTGTGKTAAFALPILNRLAANRKRPERKSCRVLVLSPTRELSAQILDSFQTYGRHLRLGTALAIGGVKMGPQIRALANGTDVFVATPGRLLDLMRSRAVTLDHVETFVLDEADRMLDMGFIHDIRTIIGKLPAQRQTLLFSATMPQAISELAGKMLRQPKTVAVTPVATTAEKVAQRVIHVDRASKPALLADVLKTEPVERALVFSRTKHGADKIVRGLVKAGISAHAIHGNKSQNQRTRVLADFRDGRIKTLIATDIAARGIDVDGISHVINYDLPEVPESYVHRIGRTARAGAEGVAISFCSRDEVPLLRAIEKTIRLAIPASGQTPATAPHAQPPRPQHNGRPHGRPQQQRGHGRPQQHANGGSPKSANGHPRNQTKHQAKQQQPHHNGHSGGQRHAQAQRAQQPASDGTIGSVAFMHRKPAPRAARRPERRSPASR